MVAKLTHFPPNCGGAAGSFRWDYQRNFDNFGLWFVVTQSMVGYRTKIEVLLPIDR